MNLQTKSQNGVTVVALSGEYSMHNSPDLDRALKNLLASGQTRLVIDLSQVSYMDSSAIATLVECFRQVNQNKGAFALAALHEKLKPIFDLLHLEKVFKIFPSVAEAAKGL